MDRAAKLSKEKTYSLWKFEQKLLMNFAEFYWTTRFVDLLFCQVNNYWIFEIRVEVNCPNVQPFFNSNSKESIHLFKLYWKCIWGYFILLS